MSDEPVIHCRDAIPHTNGQVALAPLNLRLEAASVVGMVGSHFGHTCSYLRLLSGVEPPQSGEVSYSEEAAGHVLHGGVALVTWRTPLVSVFNGMHNVLMPAFYHGKEPRQLLEERAKRLVEQTGCEFDHTLLPAYMSPLQQTMLSIVRALMLKPKAICIEEPFHRIQGEERNMMVDYLLNLRDSGVAMVVATDDLDYLSHEGDSMVFIGSEGAVEYPSWKAFCQAGGEVAAHLDERCRDCRAVTNGLT